MIYEFQESLKRLLMDPNDLFHIHIRGRIGKKATYQFEKKVKEFILRMPSVVSRIGEMIMNEKEDSQAKRLGEYLLIYLYDPMDFLPEQDEGLFGYLDDAYFAAIVYLTIVQKMNPSLKTDEDEKIKEWLIANLESVRYLIPDEAKKIEKTVSGIETNQILCYSRNR